MAALLEAAHRTGLPAHAGLTATAPGFYGPQGRPIPQLPIRYPDLADRMARQGVVNFEMEASALLTLSPLPPLLRPAATPLPPAGPPQRFRDQA